MDNLDGGGGISTQALVAAIVVPIVVVLFIGLIGTAWLVRSESELVNVCVCILRKTVANDKRITIGGATRLPGVWALGAAL